MRNSSLILGATTALYTPAIVHMSAYANTLTDLFPSLYAGLDVVSREIVGYIPSAARSSNAERAALNQTVTYSVAPEAVAEDVVPSMTISTPPDKNMGNGQMTISKSRKSAFGFSGEEQMALDTGVGYDQVQADLFAQALRVLTNEIETDLAQEAYVNASRAFGVAGTTPFATDVRDTSQVKKILTDNGAPLTGRSLVIDTSAGANLISIPNLTRVNEAGATMTLRQGEIGMIHGFSVKESGQSANHTAGTGASATTNAAGYAEGATVITLANAGTGTIVRGDVVSFAGDDNMYVVAAGDTNVANGGTITLAAPGLRQAIPASAVAVTVRADYTANVGFSADALHLATRAPAVPRQGDAAVDRQVLTDPRSGLSFEVSLWAGERMMKMEAAIAWGVKAVKPAHMALLLG